jgi:LysM repeat protein
MAPATQANTGAAAAAPASATQALAGTSGGGAASPTGAAQAAAGANATKGGGPSSEEAIIEALKALIDVLNKLVAALMAQVGGTSGGGPGGKGDPAQKTDVMGAEGGGVVQQGGIVQQGHVMPPAKFEVPTTKTVPGQVAASNGGPVQQFEQPVQKFEPPVKFEQPTQKFEPPVKAGGETSPVQGTGVVQQGGGPTGAYELRSWTIEPGDSYEAVAARFNTSVDFLRQANHNRSWADLKAGQLMMVPTDSSGNALR